MTGVTTQHPEYMNHHSQWVKVDDVCKGQKAVKAKGKTYLPVPESFGDGSDKRYDEYLERAVFYGVTGRTLNSQVGLAFNKVPTFNHPEDLDYLTKNADGAGRSIYQVAQRMTRLIMKHYRCAVYVDYPKVAASRNRNEDKLKNAYPMIHVLSALAVINWDTIVVGNQRKLSLVVIAEKINEITSDGFSRDEYTQYRVLRLDDQGYSVQVYKPTDKKGLDYSFDEPYYPTDYHGNKWDYIPFTFCGAIDNSDEILNAPLLELADLNLAHFRNSADVEESAFIVGQPTVSMPDLSIEMYQEIQKQKLYVGCRAPFPTKVEFAQAEQNNLATSQMDRKWEQMKELGARLTESGSANKTATQADNEDTVQHSVLSLVTANISEALQIALRWCAKFAMPDQDLLDDELSFVISQDFNKPKYDLERSKHINELVLQRVYPKSVLREYNRSGAMPAYSDDELDEMIEKEQDGAVLLVE